MTIGDLYSKLKRLELLEIEKQELLQKQPDENASLVSYESWRSDCNKLDNETFDICRIEVSL